MSRDRTAKVARGERRRSTSSFDAYLALKPEADPRILLPRSAGLLVTVQADNGLVLELEDEAF